MVPVTRPSRRKTYDNGQLHRWDFNWLCRDKRSHLDEINYKRLRIPTVVCCRVSAQMEEVNTPTKKNSVWPPKRCSNNSLRGWMKSSALLMRDLMGWYRQQIEYNYIHLRVADEIHSMNWYKVSEENPKCRYKCNYFFWSNYRGELKADHFAKNLWTR